MLTARAPDPDAFRSGYKYIPVCIDFDAIGDAIAFVAWFFRKDSAIAERHEDVIGRSQKVGKEEIIGMVKALELYLKEDHEALSREWQGRLDGIAHELAKVPGVTTSFFTPDIANHGSAVFSTI